MISYDPFHLRPIWDATLDIYKEIDKVCDRHGLRYYVTDGTLIGAIRHKGFIPWDDDFDMSMPRPDYEKFIEYAKTELPPHLKFVNWKNTPEFQLMFGKVQDCRRELIEDLEHQSGIKMANGLFVDIFPIDGYPSGVFSRMVIKAVNFVLSQDMNFRFTRLKDRSWKGRILHPLGAVFSALLPWLRTYADFQAVYEQILLRYPYAVSENTGRASVCLHGLNRPPLSKTAWGEGRTVEFHDTQVVVPSDSHAYLSMLYGDYMKLPPESKRHPTHTYAKRCPWWLGPTIEK